MKRDNKVLLIDGMALLFRAFYATAMSGYYMINSKGIPTNGIHGFVRHLLTAVNHFKPSHVVCCWDMGSTTFRKELYPDYKANRGEPPVELIPQFDLVKDVVAAFDIPNVGLKGFEADDCIGTLANQYKHDYLVYILTGDQDILQLIDENTHVVLLKNGYGNYEVYHPELLVERKGIRPQQLIDLKALMGDSSDNYPGVRGIGEKTALKLLQEFETIEGILENLHSLTKGQRAKIEQDLEMLHLSRKLATIHRGVPVSCPPQVAMLTIDRSKVFDKFAELEFKGLEKFIG
ncbi:5'-3' exonuclease [Calidifontibacillus oryziterrae]|uniref:5'-3' exonuclease n=1 Tax=Calidifontibacillus oryziterrae TaxID=1191699 RepID=UPI0003023A58|nr:5'-3' exonuclease H3TH domain-containing protein [Calidifontibacillus oryziterrae]